MLPVALIVLNIFTLVLFDWDKTQAARGGWRISERSFLLLAFCGGWPALKLGQWLFRHKTRKQPFKTLLTLTIGLNLVAVAVLGSVAGPELRAQALGWPEVPLSTWLTGTARPQPKVGFDRPSPTQGTHRFFQPARG